MPDAIQNKNDMPRVSGRVRILASDGKYYKDPTCNDDSGIWAIRFNPKRMFISADHLHKVDDIIKLIARKGYTIKPTTKAATMPFNRHVGKCYVFEFKSSGRMPVEFINEIT